MLTLAGLVMAGCAGPVAERAFQEVAGSARERAGQTPRWIKTDRDALEVREELDRLLAAPLTADHAVQIALINNRRLQAEFAELGIAAADLTRSWRPPNLGFTYSRIDGHDREIERTFSINVLGLLTLPIAAEIEARRFEHAKLKAVQQIMAVAAETRRAWFLAVAAQQAADYAAQVRESTAAQAELGRRMQQAGNLSLLDYAREQVFHAEATARLAEARLRAGAARERLARRMGLWGKDLAFTLPGRLPDLPQTIPEAEGIEAKAIAERLDIRMARAELDGMSSALGLSHATRFVNALEYGYIRNREEGLGRRTGYEISIEIPLFDFGDAKVTTAESLYLQSVNRLAETAINARSAVREAYGQYRTAHDIARHYRHEIVPTRRRISDEMLLRYNGMLVSVFELLSDARDQIQSVVAAIEAERDFWLAETDMRFVTIADVGEAGAVRPSRLDAPAAKPAAH
jgi:outer membrane protein TolC